MQLFSSFYIASFKTVVTFFFPHTICFSLSLLWASLVAQLVKNPPAMWETCVQSLGGEDPLEKEMATHSSILAWKLSWMEEPGRL